MQVSEGSSSMNPPDPIVNLSNAEKMHQIYHLKEKTSHALKSIGFDGSTKICVEFVRAERQLICLKGEGVDSDDESNPFFCDMDLVSNLELHEAPGLVDVNWDNEQIRGIHYVLAPMVLDLLTPQFPITKDNNVGGWPSDDGQIFFQGMREDVGVPSTSSKKKET